MPTNVGILQFMSRKNLLLSWAEHEKSFITARPGFHYTQLFIITRLLSWYDWDTVEKNTKAQISSPSYLLEWVWQKKWPELFVHHLPDFLSLQILWEKLTQHCRSFARHGLAVSCYNCQISPGNLHPHHLALGTEKNRGFCNLFTAF